MSGEQDMRYRGALKNKIPVTHWPMWVGSVAIAGIPGLAGFFSKDEILWQAYSSPLGSKALYAVGLTTAGMTAFYMWRLMNMTFYGKSRVKPELAAHIHESPASTCRKPSVRWKPGWSRCSPPRRTARPSTAGTLPATTPRWNGC
jgi:NADH-quinone oxidoreductase subunit L